jgi:hypothetical protein
MALLAEHSWDNKTIIKRRKPIESYLGLAYKGKPGLVKHKTYSL